MSRFKNLKPKMFSKLLGSSGKNTISHINFDRKTVFSLVSSYHLKNGQLAGNENFSSKFLKDFKMGRETVMLSLKFSSLSDSKCWNCHQFLECKKFCCKLCGSLQHPKNNMNYFELFGIPQTFDMNLDDLSSKFRDLQKTFHPDKFANKSKMELEISEIYSSLLNKAYGTLKEPLRRGLYLLELKKLPKDESFLVEQEFLALIMEKNEELESLNSEKSLLKFMKSNNEEITKQVNLISKSFVKNNWKEAKANLLKLNYYINLDVKAKEKQSNLFLSTLK